MFTIDQYSKIKRISRRTCFAWIKSGIIRTQRIGKKILILDDQEIIASCTVNETLKQKKLVWDSMILEAHHREHLRKDAVEQITKEVRYFTDRGFKVVGYNEKSLYRKIKDGTVCRKKRDEKREYRNEMVMKSLEKILAAASYFYIENANKNIHLTTDLVLEHARQNENYYEIASIPRSTLYRVINRELKARGIEELHEYLNHFNLWNSGLPRVEGSWTEEVQFMDWIVGDDHKCDVHRVLEFDELKNILADKTLYTWFWIEGRTQKVLSYIIQTREITADDLKMSLMVALKYNGLPQKGIMTDNGIAKSTDFKSFCSKMDLELKYSKPYEPTGKATAERIFGYIKNEHDVFFNNFTGSDHKREGRHTWKSLTPDKPDYTFEDFKSSLEGYIDGFYENRVRTRKIDGKKVRASIKDYFNDCCMHYDPVPVDDIKLRRAYQLEDVKKYRNGIIYKGYTFLPNQYLSPVFNNRKYTIAYNPNNLSCIDIYATESFIDKTTGEAIQPGHYIATLTNQVAIPMSERPGFVNKIKQSQKKSVKLLADHYIDKVVAGNPELINAVNSTVSNGGKIKNIRKQIEKEVRTALISAVPEREIRHIITSTAERETKPIEQIIHEDSTAIVSMPELPDESDIDASISNLLDEINP